MMLTILDANGLVACGEGEAPAPTPAPEPGISADRQQVLDREKAGRGGVELEDEESEEEDEEALEMEEEDEGWGDREFVSDVSGDEDGLSDLEDVYVSLAQSTVLTVKLKLFAVN